MSELVRIENLKVYYPVRSGFFNRITDNIKAVDDVSFTIEAGQTYGLVGESGSGKTTIGKSLVGLENPTSGKILFEGQEVTQIKQKKAINYNKDGNKIQTKSIMARKDQTASKKWRLL